MYRTRLTANAGRKSRQKSASGHHRTTLSGYIFATKARIDNRKKLLSMSPQYCELKPASGWDLLASLGHPCKFQWVLRLGFVSAATSLNGSQPNLAQCLALPGLVDFIYTFGSCCSVTEFCQCKIHFASSKSCALLFASLLHGSRAVGASQTLRRWAKGTTYIWQGDHQVGHWPTF